MATLAPAATQVKKMAMLTGSSDLAFMFALERMGGLY